MTRYLLLFVLLVTVYAYPIEKYETKYDNYDVDRILRSDRVLTNYIRCLLGEGSCTPEARELKKILPDALSTHCIRCTQKQQNNIEKVRKHLKARRPRDWERLITRFDPQGVYEKYFDGLHNNKKV